MMRLVAVLFRGTRFVDDGNARVGDQSCFNCRKRVKPGTPVFRAEKGSHDRYRVLHPACALAIAEHNEKIAVEEIIRAANEGAAE